MSQEETRVIPAATPNASPIAPEDGLTPKVQTAVTLTPGVYVPALQPTSEQRVLEEVSSKQQKITTTITPRVAGLAPQPTSEQRALIEINRPKDDLDMMIEEALKMGNLVSHSQLLLLLFFFFKKNRMGHRLSLVLGFFSKTNPEYSLRLKTTSRKTNTPQQTTKTPPRTRKNHSTVSKGRNLRLSGLGPRKWAAGREHSSVCKRTMECKGMGILISELSRSCRKCRSITR